MSDFAQSLICIFLGHVSMNVRLCTMVALTELYCWSYLCWASSYFKATAVINMRLIVVVIIELLVMLKLCMIWSVLMIHTIILRFWNVVRLHIFSFNKTLMLAILDTVFRACFGGVCSCTSTNVFHRVVVFYICLCDCVSMWLCHMCVCVCVKLKDVFLQKFLSDWLQTVLLFLSDWLQTLLLFLSDWLQTVLYVYILYDIQNISRVVLVFVILVYVQFSLHVFCLKRKA